jgi:hypothetical protein
MLTIMRTSVQQIIALKWVTACSLGTRAPAFGLGVPLELQYLPCLCVLVSSSFLHLQR